MDRLCDPNTVISILITSTQRSGARFLLGLLMAILTPAIVYRRYVVDGVPDSGQHDPKKTEIIQLLDTLFGANDAAWVVAPTLAALVLITPDSEKDGGIVLSDPDPTKNGYYYRAAGAWARGRGFPDSLAVLDDIEGTANAITASTLAWVNPSDVQMMILEVATTVEAGGVTIALNGGAAKPLVTNSGNSIEAGYLTAGMLVSFIDDGTNYRLVSDVASLAVLAGAEAAADAAADSADEAAGYATLARSNWLPIRFAGNGVATAFNLGVDPGSGNNCFVSIEGVLQDTTTYSLAGTILTFSTAPPGNGVAINIEVRMGTAIAVGAPADGSVTNPKIGTNAVNARTIDATDVSAIKAKLGISDGGTPAKGYFHGLKLANSGSHGITIGIGEAASDAATPIRLVLAAPLTKLLNTAWAVGNGNGGLDTGSVAAGTYHLWLIGRSSDDAVDALFSLSASAPTMPVGWDRKAYMWPVVRLASANLGFVQVGNYFSLTAPTVSANTPIAITAALLALPNVPTGASVLTDFTASIFATSANYHAYFSSPLAADAVPAPNSFSSLVTIGNSALSSGQFRLLTDSSGRIRHRASTAIPFFYATTLGWEFHR